jgi:hypothetical protein
LAGKWDSRSNFNLDAGCDKDDSDSKTEGPSSVGLNFVNGDALSLLLEKKLKELTSKIDPSITFTRGDTFTAATFNLEEAPSSSCSNWGSESGVFDCSPSEVKPSQYDYCPSAQSSTKGQIFRGSKLKVHICLRSPLSFVNNMIAQQNFYISHVISFCSGAWKGFYVIIE